MTELARLGRAIGGLKSQAKADREAVRRIRMVVEMLAVWAVFFSLTVILGRLFR